MARLLTRNLIQFSAKKSKYWTAQTQIYVLAIFQFTVSASYAKNDWTGLTNGRSLRLKKK